MTVADFFTEIRYQLSDENSAGYADNELLTYLNQAQDYVYTTLIDHESNLAIKSSTVTLTDGEGSLPSDFVHEDSVLADSILNAVSPSTTVTGTTFKVLADTIYSDNDSLTLYYFYMPDRYSGTGDTLLCPSYMESLYRQILIFLTLNTDEFDTSIEQALANRFESKVLSIAGKRGNSNNKATMPFMV